jgi:hypothetical protein
LAEKSTQLILEALNRAAADPEGVPLHSGKAATGLFSSTAAGKQAARQCKEEGLLRTVRTESKGKTTTEVCAITEKGLAFLLCQVSPRQVFEEFLRVLHSRQGQVEELLSTARRMQESMDALKGSAERAFQQVLKPAHEIGSAQVSNGAEIWLAAVMAYLARHLESGATDDCALPVLYRHAQQTAPRLTIGQFHDGLRKLHDQQQIYLHGWTGPLYDLPEPPLALLVGHEIAYYASIHTRTLTPPEVLN